MLWGQHFSHFLPPFKEVGMKNGMESGLVMGPDLGAPESWSWCGDMDGCSVCTVGHEANQHGPRGCGSYSRASWIFQAAHELLGRTWRQTLVVCPMSGLQSSVTQQRILSHGQHKMVCHGPQDLPHWFPTCSCANLIILTFWTWPCYWFWPHVWLMGLCQNYSQADPLTPWLSSPEM